MHVPEALIANCAKHDRRAQNELFRLLAPYLAAVCRRYLINPTLFDDCMQETFIRLFTHIERYDPAKGAFKTWAVRIAVNVCLKAEQKERKHLAKDLDGLHEPSAPPRIYSELEIAFISQKIKDMPRTHYEVFNMHVVDGFTYPEIAEDLGISQDLVRQRLSRARKWIKTHIERDDQGNRLSRVAT